MSLLDDLISQGRLDWDDFNRCWAESPFGDGLPVAPPSPERIAAMLGGRDPSRCASVLAPSRQEATNARLAACAVMTGCIPEVFPLLRAAVEAVAEPEFNLLGVQTTTGNAAVGLLVHGPAVGACGLNAAGNTLGPGTASNAALGRALAISLRAIGEALPGRTDMATLGQPAKFGFCLAENEPASPWPPLHTTRGCAAGDSAVTVFSAMGLLEVVDGVSTGAGSLLTTFARSMTSAGLLGGTRLLGGGSPLLLLAPEHAEMMARECSREQAQAILFEQARLPVAHLAPEARSHLLHTTPPGTQPREAGRETVSVAHQPGDILLAVAGGIGRKSAYIPSWSGSSRAVTRRVEMDG